MSKYYSVPFYSVGEDEPRLALLLPELGLMVSPSPNWFVPVSQLLDSNGGSGLIDQDGNDIPDSVCEWAHVILDNQ